MSLLFVEERRRVRVWVFLNEGKRKCMHMHSWPRLQ